MNNQTYKKKISVFGLGKLGVPVVACFLSKGYEIIGVDLDENKVASLKELKSPVYEPRVQELLNSFGKLLKVTCNGIQAVLETDITFVIVSTPSEHDGSFSNKYVLASCEVIGKALQKKDKYHLVVITSTVMPGSMNNVIKPFLEKVSGKRSGIDFGLCYNPEFIALGSVVRDFLNPDFVLIGESDKMAGETLASIYPVVYDNNPPIVRMNFINAELAKLSVNTFVTTKISFANMLARICEKTPRANVDIITQALGMDSRIGKEYLKGAISYGGPCFPRDNVALTTFAKSIGVKADIIEATDKFNRSQIKWLSELVLKYLPKGGVVAILGLSYKVGSNVVEESPGILLAEELLSRKISLVVFDPVSIGNSKSKLKDLVTYAASPQECIERASVIVVTTPWREFSGIPAKKWLKSNSLITVIDCWRILGHLADKKDLKYISLGVGS